MINRSLNNSFVVNGDWFLPENPERVIAGRLSYSAQQTVLELNEAFTPLDGTISPHDEVKVYPVIYGKSTNGDAITLQEIFQTSSSTNIGSGGISNPEILQASWLFFGAHIPDNSRFSEINLRIPGLQVWYSQPLIHFFQTRDSVSDEIILNYSIPPSKQEPIFIPAIEAEYKWGIGRNTKTDKFSELSVDISAWLTIKPREPQLLNWYFDQIFKATTLFSILAGTSMIPDCIETSDENSRAISILIGMRNTKTCQFTQPYQFFMPINSIEKSFDEVIKKWFDEFPKIQIPVQLALSVLSSEELWLNMEFLSLMQVLEGFHRCIYDGYYMDEKEYLSIQQILTNAIPPKLNSDHKDALKSRIKYGNEYSLKKRLDELSNMLSESVRKIIIGKNGKIPQKWIDTRNYYTHWDEELQNGILDSQTMYFVNFRLKMFIRALFIVFMGIPEEALLKSLGNLNTISRFLKDINSRG